MKINFVVAYSKNRCIGKNNDLPWHLPQDLKRFKELTTGKTVLMGRKTYDSIISRLGKPLPNRKNVVLTRQDDLDFPEGVEVFNSIDEALNTLDTDELYVIGGAQIFEEVLDRADKIYATEIDKNIEGDTFFPELDSGAWEKTNEDIREGYSFSEYIRV